VTGNSPFVEVGEYIFPRGGAAAAVGDIDKNGKPDVILATYSIGLTTSARFSYAIGWDVTGRAIASRWTTTFRQLDALGNAIAPCDVGAALADIDRNGTLDLVLSTFAREGNEESFYYRVGWNLDATGTPRQVGPLQKVASGFGFVDAAHCHGSGAAIADIDGNGVKDLVLMANVGPNEGGGNFRLRVGLDLALDGTVPAWRNYTITAIMGSDFEPRGADIAVTDVDLNGKPDVVLGLYANRGNSNAYRYVVGWDLNGLGSVSNLTRWFQLRGVGGDVNGIGLAQMSSQSDGPRLIALAYRRPAGASARFRYLSVPLTTSGAYFPATDPPPRVNNSLQVPTGRETLTGARLFNLNMAQVRNTAEDAFAEFTFGCFLSEALNPAQLAEVCRYGTSPDATFGKMLGSENFNMATVPDAIAASAAYYVDAHMGWVEDAANSWVLNDYFHLNYYAGAEKSPAYYTIHYTDPGANPGLLTALQAKDDAWALAYNDGNRFHGDCEDHAILRQALMRSLGFDSGAVWNANAPGHEFNLVTYRGAWRVVDYGPMGNYFDAPSSINAGITNAWNETHPPTLASEVGRDDFRDTHLRRIYPDRCGTGPGMSFTVEAYPDSRW